MPRAFVDPGDMTPGLVGSRVLLSGASGMLGAALRHTLAARRMAMLQLVRSAATDQDQLQWDPTKPLPSEKRRGLEGCSAAIHLSGANLADRRWSAAYRETLRTSRVESTRSLATALAALREPPQSLLVASAIGFYGDRGDELLTEASVRGLGFLADMCQQWEAAAEPAAQAGIRVVHLRFGVVIGPGHGALERMLTPFRLGLGGRLGSGRQWMSWISLTDAISAIVFALEASSLSGPVNLTAPNPVTNAQFTQALAHQLGRPAVLTVPSLALRIVLGPMADEALLASTRALPAKLQAARFPFVHSTIEEALSATLAK